MMDKKVNIAEKAGTKLSALLTKANPWGDAHCGRESCLVCGQNGVEGGTNTAKQDLSRT